MGFLPSLPEKTNLSDVFKAYPKGVGHLLRYHDAILRSPSPFTIGERELIAALVSRLNGCEFCSNAHTFYTESYGMAEGLVDDVVADIFASGAAEKMKPVLAYVKKLTLAPATVAQSDVDAILDAGWPEEAVHDAVVVTALYNFMNRFIEGTGIDPFADDYAKRSARVRKRPIEQRLKLNEDHIGDDNYTKYGRMLGVIED